MPEIPTQKQLNDWRMTTVQQLEAAQFKVKNLVTEIERLRKLLHEECPPAFPKIGCLFEHPDFPQQCVICGEQEPDDA